jgi:hypothetical protein
MSRTIHHVPVDRRRCGWNPDRGYWSRHQIDDLRYSALVEVEAARSRRRPLPERRVHARAFHRFPRATGDREYAYYERATARRDRRRDRKALGQLAKQLRAVAVSYGDETAADYVDDMMPVLTRPVRDADWWVW